VVTYTNNWPHEPLIGNQPSAENIVWSIASIVVLLAGVGLLVWAWAFLRRHDEPLPAAAAQDPLRSFALTPSQHALGKYLFLIPRTTRSRGSSSTASTSPSGSRMR
jgi:nitric oxide reductase subunit B